MKPNDILTINCTLKILACDLHVLEHKLRANYEVIDYKILPDTDALYEKDPNFRKLVKSAKDIKKLKEVYINDHN
jgi:hypothetical protein